VPSAGDNETFDEGTCTIELFGNQITLNVAHESGQKVGNLWDRETFLRPAKPNLWAGASRASESFGLTDDLILNKLINFVDNPAKEGFQLWD
jgi:hypothetical protein